MSPVALSLLALAAASGALAQSETSSSFVPLASKHFTYPDLPYQVDPADGDRGPQQGYNLCNSTTEGDSSLCQTGFLNHLDDFCLWAPPTADQTIADTEGLEVAWCTKAGKGTRIIPAGALTGVQYMKTPGYLQVVGFIDQTKINIQADDGGGELDPHGADLRGNPLGGLMFSNGFASNNGNNDTYQQVIEWHNFMGSNAFCFKVCDPAGPNAAELCQHIFDRIGVEYNCPNAAQNGTFEYCEGDNQDPPGIYTASDGSVQTYTQPAESLGVITSMPYQPKIPASSNCVQLASAALYTDLVAASGAATSAAGASGSAATGSSAPTAPAGSSASRTGSSGAAAATGSAAASADTNGAAAMRISAVATVAGVMAAVAFLA